MPKSMSSRERMLAAISCRQVDYTPCSFMIFSAMSARSKGQLDRIDRELALGLDPFISLPVVPPPTNKEHRDLYGLGVSLSPQVKCREWKDKPADSRYPLLYREYVTPAGAITVCTEQSEDWPYGDHVPFLDDFLIPRSHRYLVESEKDLAPLRFLLTEPTADERSSYIADAREARKFADGRGVLLTYGWGVIGDALGWLCGLRNLPLIALDNPSLMKQLIEIVAAWDRRRMEVVLDAGIDVYVRRGWYEGVDFWSPALYRQYLLPHLRDQAALAHSKGAKYAYIHTTGTAPLLDQIMEAGVDVMIGVDPVEGQRTDLRQFKARTQGRMALWGGVNGFVTVERGAEPEVRQAVREAMDIMAPGGGFVLSPVDNIRDTSDAVWNKVLAFVDEWKKRR